MTRRRLAQWFLLVALTVSAALPAVAAPDYEPMKRAIHDFEAYMAALGATVLEIHDSNDVVRTVDGYTAVMNEFGEAMGNLLRQNPELTNLRQPPPELAELMRSFIGQKSKYMASSTLLNGAIAKYSSDPAVGAAVARLKQAINRPELSGGRQR